MRHRLRQRWKAPLASLVGALACLAVGWIARDGVLAANGDVGAALRNLAAWSGDAGKIALGALIGALGAWIVARTNREEARRTRFHDDLRRVATDLYQAAERHRVEREAQWTAWNQVAGHHLDPDKHPIPAVGSTEPIFDAAVALDLVASRPTTKAAWDLWAALVWLDRFEYNAAVSRHGGAVERPSETDRDWNVGMRSRYVVALSAFANAVRGELGIERLADPDLSDIGSAGGPAGEGPVASLATLAGQSHCLGRSASSYAPLSSEGGRRTGRRRSVRAERPPDELARPVSEPPSGVRHVEECLGSRRLVWGYEGGGGGALHRRWRQPIEAPAPPAVNHAVRVPERTSFRHAEDRTRCKRGSDHLLRFPF